VNDKLGKYEIRRELGRGAMGVVYEAYDPMIKRVVALKTIRADQLQREDAPVVLARFRREAQAAGRLNHPNIVSIYDFDEDAGTSFIAMEYVTGRDLRECFEGGERFKTADAVRLMGQILDALDYSHRQGVIHRDVKPANVFLPADGSVKVADFGIAHIDSSSLTQDGSVMGTPSYMSPEQILGLPVDGRSDLFSAGVILYQFLTGERPFSGSSTTTMQKVLKEDPLPPTTLNVQLPDAIDAVVHKALAKRPEDRYQTAAEFAADLRAAVGPRTAPMPTPARPVSDSQATELHVPSSPTLPTSDGAANASPRSLPYHAGEGSQPFPSPGRGSEAGGARGEGGMAPPVPPAPSYRPGASSATPPPGKSQTAAIAVVLGIAFIAVAAGLWVFLQYGPGQSSKATTVAASQPTSAATIATPTSAPNVPAQAAAPVSTTIPSAPAAADSASKQDPGSVVIAAQGLADPSNPRYQGNTSLLQADLRADAKSQLVEKALGLLVERSSLAKNYDVLSERLMAKSPGFIGTVMRESEPRIGKDGLMSMTTEAVVNVKAVQKSLNQMSRDDRIELIRANGNPRIAMRIAVYDADRPDAPPRASPIAENLLKDRVKTFGFRTWAESSERGVTGDFIVSADAKVRRLTTRLEASGITVTKYAVTALTVKCIDQATGEEIYFKTVLPKGTGSWATEEEALTAIGGRIADEFSRDFFLQNMYASGQRVTLVVNGLPDANAAELVGRELVSLPAVIGASRKAGANPPAWDLQLAGSGAAGDLVASGVVSPLNAKLGQACLSQGASTGDEVQLAFDKRCNDPAVISRLETHPPAGLYGAPPTRQKSVITNPETLRKLSI
jgi:eukaryotic-like serine/threonine-protein kinase